MDFCRIVRAIGCGGHKRLRFLAVILAGFWRHLLFILLALMLVMMPIGDDTKLFSVSKEQNDGNKSNQMNQWLCFRCCREIVPRDPTRGPLT